ncbi:putative NADH dehydrogenase [ubiquinone] iron-sulfur protein 6, mitochondrial [Trichinella papuae]|uniref:Putative NADH dehydrogenase [ubiquinone] iron-sulfur protein 6, mitochondrial n=1 Tax=Trichinella papuae TaxID=268474 RepID=A0A0V1MF54_9BILA|nr:putative NADH dehydrogenase [ubiquinone] iron-sulfur protein 6, mitochondrial [Trichinella papuae]
MCKIDQIGLLTSVRGHSAGSDAMLFCTRRRSAHGKETLLRLWSSVVVKLTVKNYKYVTNNREKVKEGRKMWRKRKQQQQQQQEEETAQLKQSDVDGKCYSKDENNWAMRMVALTGVYLTGTEGRRGALRANKSMARVHLSRLVRYCQARRLDTVSNLPKSHDEVKAVIGSELQYDTITHTGQAWDQYDRRLGRFEYGKKLVNPNLAMELIAQVKPAASKERIVHCDGGGAALGHPRVFINLDKPGNHACGYCGLRFYNENVPSDGSDQIEV